MNDRTIPIFTGTAGLNTVLDPQRLLQASQRATTNRRDTEAVIELAVAVNVSIDDRGLVTLRKGDTLAQAGSFHSLFCDGGDCFVIQERTEDAALMQVGTDFSLSGVRSGLTKNHRMSFTDSGNTTYYSNGLQNGVITAGASYDWPVDVYNGPETNLQLSAAPVGNHIAFKPGGLMLIAVGPVLWINHFPYIFGLYSLARGFVNFASDIRMICPVAGGVFVSDSTSTWFLRGTSWFDFVQVQVATYPALEWSLAYDKVKLQDMGFDVPGFGRIWASTEGVCVGTDDGTLINLTDGQIKYPSGYSSAACLVTDSHILHTV